MVPPPHHWAWQNALRLVSTNRLFISERRGAFEITATLLKDCKVPSHFFACGCQLVARQISRRAHFNAGAYYRSDRQKEFLARSEGFEPPALRFEVGRPTIKPNKIGY
jgi:hypothetical protein